jgi:hypothetical protein
MGLAMVMVIMVMLMVIKVMLTRTWDRWHMRVRMGMY